METGLFKFELIDNHGIKKWWILPGSNQRPKVYETSALTTELRIHKMKEYAARASESFSTFRIRIIHAAQTDALRILSG